MALKLLPPALQKDAERVRWLHREARAAAALNHPNIMTVYEVGDSEGQHFIAAEFVDGETLAQQLRRGRLSVQQTLLIGEQIAAALAVAHNAGIIHRDLKPANVMLRPDGAVKVLDFELARFSQAIRETEETETVTGVGGLCGTLAYMSPEQVRGETAGADSDLWSFGVLLYEALAGRRPFEGEDNAALIAAIVAGNPPSLRSINKSIPAEVDRLVVNRLLVNDRERRRGSAAEIAGEINRLSASAAGVPVIRRRRRFIAAAVLAALVLLTIAVGVIYRSSKRRWARDEAIPEIHTLIEKGDCSSAYRLTLQAGRYIPQHVCPN